MLWCARVEDEAHGHELVGTHFPGQPDPQAVVPAAVVVIDDVGLHGCATGLVVLGMILFLEPGEVLWHQSYLLRLGRGHHD